MAKDITVGFDGLKQSANEMRAAESELGGELRETQTTLNGLKTTGFDTRSAGPAFQNAQTQWHKAMGELTSSLKDFARAADETIQKHEQSDSTLTEGANRLGGTGGGAA